MAFSHQRKENGQEDENEKENEDEAAVCTGSSSSSSSGSDWACMGDITPLSDLDYRTVEPLRIYKFNPKYFLTMGGSLIHLIL